MATTAPIILPIQTPGLNNLQKLEKRMEALEKDYAKVAVTAPKATNQIKRFGDQARKTESKVDGLTKSLRGFLTAAALFSTAKFIVGKTSELETQTRSLKVLTGELETAQKIVSQLQKFASVTPFTSSELIESAKRLKAFGVDTEKLVSTTKQLADVSGATGARLNEVATAYGQIQAKGRLQGEELLQLQERGIGLQDELQKMYGLTGEEFSKALQKGQFSAEAVEVAIKRLTAAGGKYADGAISQSDTLAGKFSTLTDGIENIARTLGGVLSPALKAILNEAIAGINFINQMIAMAQRAQKFGLDQRQRKGILDQARKEAEEIVNLRNIKDPFKRNQVFQDVARQRENDLLNSYGYKTGQLQVEIKPIIDDSEIPELLGGSGKTGSGAAAIKRVTGLSDAEKELAKQLRINEQLVRGVNQAYEERASAVTTIEDEIRYLQNAVKFGEDYAEKFREIRRLVMEGVSFNEAFDLVTQRDGLLSQVEAANKLNTELTETEQLLKGAYDIVAGSLTSSMQGLIDGTKEWSDVLSDVLGQLGQMFLQFGFSALGGALKIPGFANGGAPPMGQPSIVGERGPELFIPNQSGRIVSNEAMSNYMPSNGGSNDVNIRYSVTEINSMRFVTEDQFITGMNQTRKAAAADGARMGEAATMNNLRNKRSSRQRIGI